MRVGACETIGGRVHVFFVDAKMAGAHLHDVTGTNIPNCSILETSYCYLYLTFHLDLALRESQAREL